MERPMIRDHELLQYNLGELPRARMKEIQQRLQQEPDLQKRFATLQHEQAAFLKQFPAPDQAQTIQGRARILQAAAEQERPARRLPLLWLSLSGAAALLAVFLFLPGLRHSLFPPQQNRLPDHIRLKGKHDRLLIYRAANGAAHPLTDKTRVAAGDRLQVAYRVREATHGVIVSLDGRGNATLHYPATETGSTKLTQQTRTRLADSYQLDDAPGFERFFFITARTPLDAGAILGTVREFARSAGDPARDPLPLAQGLAQQSITLRK